MLDSKFCERIDTLVKEYQKITDGKETTRTCLANAYNMYWLLLEIRERYK